ncbi:MAG: hypothetical protein WCC21_02600 [Candidatus Acidiferrales bacterium]
MLRGAILVVTTGIFSLASLAFAQDSARKNQAANPPATPAGAPAPTSAAPVAGNPPTSTDTKDASASGMAAKPKKVWTNDDMGSLDHHSDVSVVGKRKPLQPAYHPNSDPQRGNTDYMVPYYRQQIDSLQHQADQIDKQISTLQDAKNGKTVDSQRTYNPWGGVQGDWNAQIAQLQKNKDNVLQQIDSLEEALRKLDP